jgi:F0F1-type ATP synthase alpha subunit
MAPPPLGAAARARATPAARPSTTTRGISSSSSSSSRNRSVVVVASAASAASNPPAPASTAAAAAPPAAAAAAAARRTNSSTRRRHRARPTAAAAARASRGGPNDGASDEEEGEEADRAPDWDAEMSIFKQRTLRPNQLATLREMEGRASLGKVLSVGDGLAVLSGVDPDAPLGTALAFVSGAAGVLLWHRSDDLAFAIVLGGASGVRPGEGVECRVRGVLQLADEAVGPVTRKEFELWQSPADDAELAGRAVDFLGRPLAGFDPVVLLADSARRREGEGGAGEAGEGGPPPPPPAPEGGGDPFFAPARPPVGMARTRPLINEQVAMKSREQIGEALVTGVRAVDALTPVGRGSSLLVVGPAGSGKTALARDAVLGQSLLAAAAAAAATKGGAGKAAAAAAPGGHAGGGGGAPPSSSPATLSPSPGGVSSKTAPAAAAAGARVRCFYASTTQDAARLRATAGALLSPEGAGAGAGGGGPPFAPHDPQNVTVFASSPAAPLGERLATLCAACAAAERVRDKGGHALVVLDDVTPLPLAWEHLVAELVALGPARLREGLVKDAGGRDVPVVAPPALGGGGVAAEGKKKKKKQEEEEEAAAAAAAKAAAAAAAGDKGGGGQTEEEEEDGGLVEYEGMLVSGAVAQRRGFYSTLFMRAAKLHRALGGGTMSLVPLVPGKPATGARRPLGAGPSAPASSASSASSSGADSDGPPSPPAAAAALTPEALAERYPSLSDEQRRKLGAALARRAADAAAAAAAAPSSPSSSAAAAASRGGHELRTEIVEEFISISDGQAVMDPAVAASSSGPDEAPEGRAPSAGPAFYALNPRLSITRIGGRAHDRALAELAAQARLELAQAGDAAEFGAGAASTDDALAARARRLAAALVQPAGVPTPLEETALLLFAVKRGYADAVPEGEMRAWAARAVSFVRQVAPRALREVAATRLMTAAAEKGIADALEAMRSAGDGRGGGAAAAAAAAAARAVGGAGGGGRVVGGGGK